MKKYVFVALALVLLLIISLSIIMNWRDIHILMREGQYMVSRKPEDLIDLCSLLVDTRRFNEINKYVPLVLGIKDFSGSYLDSRIGRNATISESEKAYAVFESECIFSYIYVGRYNEYMEAFPSVYVDLLSNNEEALWYYKIAQNDKIGSSGYEVIISSLDKVCPPLPSAATAQANEMSLYIKNQQMKANAYLCMGDNATSERISTAIDKLLNEYRENHS